MMGEFVAVKRKKKRGVSFFFFSFLRTKKIKRTVSRPVHPYFFYFQFSSVTQSCPALCDPMDYSTPGFPVHHQLRSLLKLMSIALVMPSNHLILCRSLLLLPSILPSIRTFSNESVPLIRWPKYFYFSYS